MTITNVNTEHTVTNQGSTYATQTYVDLEIDTVEEQIDAIPTGTTTATTTAAPDTVGTHTRGGIIYYLFVDGDAGYVEGETHGLVVAENDLPYTYPFMNSTYSGFTTEDQSAIGDGTANTVTLVSEANLISTDFINAAKACDNYKGGGYSDWFLPSLEEMNWLCPPLWDGQVVMNIMPETSGLQQVYWTSSCYATGIWGYLYFSDVAIASGWDSGSPGWYGWGGLTTPETLRLVRPVRKF